jgi:hypothetical protein
MERVSARLRCDEAFFIWGSRGQHGLSGHTFFSGQIKGRTLVLPLIWSAGRTISDENDAATRSSASPRCNACSATNLSPFARAARTSRNLSNACKTRMVGA